MNLPKTAIQRCHRLGAKKQTSRPIIMRFVSYADRKRVFNQKKLLKGTGVVITENLSPGRLQLYKKAQANKALTSTWTVDGNVFGFYKGKVVRINSFKDIDKFT